MSRYLLVGGVILIAFATVTLFAGLDRIAPDELGLRVDNRGRPAKELPPGTHWHAPLSGSTVRYPLEPDTLLFPAPDDAGYRLFDAKGVEIPTRFVVRYQVTEGGAADAYLATAGTGTGAPARAPRALADSVTASLRRAARGVAARFLAEQLGEDADPLVRRTTEALLARELAATVRIPGVTVRARVPGIAERAAGMDVLIVGVDAGDWLVIDPLLEAGRMPHLASLIEGGVRVDFHSIMPMLSPLLWTTIATSTTPDRHGILDFLTPDPATGKMVPVTSTLRREPAFWNFLTQHGVSQAVVAWLASWPAETVSGHMVTDRFGFLAYAGPASAAAAPVADGMVWPPEYLERARACEVRAESLPPSFWQRFFDAPGAELTGLGAGGFRKGDLLGNFALTVATALTSTAVAEDIRATASPRVTAVYYEMIDAVGHLAMPYAPPRQPQIPEADYRRYHRALDAAYELQDELLGRLLATVDRERTVVMVMSDHGMKSGDARPTGSAEIEGGEAARWHRDPGMLVLAGPGIRRGERLDTRVDLLDITPTLLAVLGLPVPRTLQGRVLTEAFDAEGGDRYAPAYVEKQELRPEVWTRRHEAPADGGGPAAGSLHNNLGLVFESEGKLDEAEAEYRRALAAYPNGANARNNLAGVLIKRDRLDEAETILVSLRRDFPDYLGGLFNLGVVYQRTQRWDLAEGLFRAVLVKEPAHATARTNLGHTLLRRGRLDEAEAEFLSALQDNPAEVQAHFGLGLVAAERGDFLRAEEEFIRTLELDPDHRSAAANLERLERARTGG